MNGSFNMIPVVISTRFSYCCVDKYECYQVKNGRVYITFDKKDSAQNCNSDQLIVILISVCFIFVFIFIYINRFLIMKFHCLSEDRLK